MYVSIEISRINCRLQVSRGNVKAVDLQDGTLSVKAGGIVDRADFTGFAGQQREIIVVPENRRHIFAARAFRDTEVSHESERPAGIAYGDVRQLRPIFLFRRGLDFEPDLR